MIEYAITAGEGILLDYGTARLVIMDADSAVVHGRNDGWSNDEYPNVEIIARPCAPDCETGK